MHTIRVDWPAEMVVRITMDRPEALNASDENLSRDLAAALNEAIDDPCAAAVIITGAGGHFSAGGDIKQMCKLTRDGFDATLRRGIELVRRVAASTKPFVAAVEGAAAGGALGLALNCDYIIATPTAKFAVPFLRIGLVPDIGSIPGLVRRIGAQAARRMILERQVIDGTAAARMGLADRLVDVHLLQSTAISLAKSLAALPPHAFAETKKLLDCADSPFDDYLKREYASQSTCFGTQEYSEGMASFVEKREPVFARSRSS
jgi:2-(1,2-epoxy-1,2-dihydrophenyl)acetyl-CoA isomerase